MKLTLKTIIPFLAIALTLASPSAFSMDDSEEIQTIHTQMSHTLPEDMQKQLTAVGHTVLEKVLYEDDFDIAASGLFESIYPQLQSFLENAQYSKLATWAPSN